jgi:hypothetical protein
MLLLWSRANVVSSLSAASFGEVTGAQESQPSNASPQSSSAQAPAGPQKAPDQSTAPKPPAGTSQPCTKNSSSGSGTKTGCKHTAGTKPKKEHGAEKTVTPAPPTGDTPPPKTVVRNGSTDDPPVDLSAKPGPQASKQTEAAKQLLTSTEANLKKILGRQLSPSEQDTVKQIQTYMDQAKKATDDEDPQRAYNLAVKANLLSAELAGH